MTIISDIFVKQLPALKKIQSCSNSNVMISTKKEVPKSSDLGIEKEIDKQRKQLNKNLKTLDYISILLSNPQVLNDQQRLSSINNLKESLQYEIIRNMRLINQYKSML